MRGWIIAGVLLIGAAAAPFLYAPGAADRRIPAVGDGLSITETVIREVDVPLDRFQRWFDQAKLKDILPGSATMPRVTGSRLVSGTWGQPGAVRRVFLADGSTALETIVTRRPPDYFAYVVVPERGAGRRLVSYVLGEFHQSSIGAGRTRVEWRYSLKPRSALVAPHTAVFAAVAIAGFLENGIDAIKREAERSVGATAPRPRS